MSIIYACLYLPLRGKDYSELKPNQQKRVDKNYGNYMKSKKGQKTPDMTVEEYMPIIQKQGITFLIMALVTLPIYILAVSFLYSDFFHF